MKNASEIMELIPLLLYLTPILLIIICLFKVKRFLRRRDYESLSAEEKEKFQDKKDSDLRNLLVVILPMALFLTLKKSLSIELALSISLGLGLFMTLLFRKKGGGKTS